MDENKKRPESSIIDITPDSVSGAADLTSKSGPPSSLSPTKAEIKAVISSSKGSIGLYDKLSRTQPFAIVPRLAGISKNNTEVILGLCMSFSSVSLGMIVLLCLKILSFDFLAKSMLTPSIMIAIYCAGVLISRRKIAPIEEELARAKMEIDLYKQNAAPLSLDDDLDTLKKLIRTGADRSLIDEYAANIRQKISNDTEQHRRLNAVLDRVSGGGKDRHLLPPLPPGYVERGTDQVTSSAIDNTDTNMDGDKGALQAREQEHKPRLRLPGRTERK